WGVYRGDWSAKPAVGVLQSHTAGCIRAPRPPDAGATDAGVVPDAAASPDGSSSGTGGSSGGAPGANGDVGTGCGCSVGARPPSRTLILLWLTIVYHGRSLRPWRTTRTSKRV